MLATSRAGYPTEVQLELVVVALAWGDVLMNTCWNGNRTQSARHTWYIDAATNMDTFFIGNSWLTSNSLWPVLLGARPAY